MGIDVKADSKVGLDSPFLFDFVRDWKLSDECRYKPEVVKF